MKKNSLLLCALSAFVIASRAIGSTLYGSTSAGGLGELWILDPATGAGLQDIGPLNDSQNHNYAVTGIAFNPVTGVLYGSTGGVSGKSLLTIDPATALVTVVGPFNAGSATMSDLAFDSAGNLYGISSSGGANLYTINLATGQATQVGPSGVSFTTGGGLAISPGGVFYGTPTSDRFGTFDPNTGLYSNITNPTKPGGSGTSYAALTFDGNTLYGIDLASTTHLVTIDPSGNVTDLGTSVTSIDGIAFRPAAVNPSSPTLSIKQASNSVLIQWVSSSVFRLQQNSNLLTAIWVDNTNMVTSSGTTNQVVVPATDSSKFFRLIFP